MAHLLLVNPRKRRRNPESRAKRSHAAKLGWRHRRSYTTHRRRRRNPESRAERSAAARAGWTHRRRRHHTRHHHMRRRRNPISRKMSFFSPVMPAAIAAVGSIGLSLIWGYAPIPATWKTGTLGYAAKGIGALALGAVLGMFMKKSTAELLATGALTVVIADGMKAAIQKTDSTIQLGEIMPDYTNGSLTYPAPGVTISNNASALPDYSGNAGMGEIQQQYNYVPSM